MVGKSEKPRWVYDFDCSNCAHLQYVRDAEKKRDGMYCIPTIEAVDRRSADWTPFNADGSLKNESASPIHADDDRHLRCDCYVPRSEQVDLFKYGSLTASA